MPRSKETETCVCVADFSGIPTQQKNFKEQNLQLDLPY